MALQWIKTQLQKFPPYRMLRKDYFVHKTAQIQLRSLVSIARALKSRTM